MKDIKEALGQKCPSCGRRITRKEIQKQEAVRVKAEHAISMTQTDYMFDFWFCSRKCFENFMGSSREKQQEILLKTLEEGEG